MSCTRSFKHSIQPQPGSVHQACHQPVPPAHLAEYRRDLLARQHHRHALWTFRPRDAVDPVDLAIPNTCLYRNNSPHRA